VVERRRDAADPTAHAHAGGARRVGRVEGIQGAGWSFESAPVSHHRVRARVCCVWHTLAPCASVAWRLARAQHLPWMRLPDAPPAPVLQTRGTLALKL
jgi:hypothetical protein